MDGGKSYSKDDNRFKVARRTSSRFRTLLQTSRSRRRMTPIIGTNLKPLDHKKLQVGLVYCLRETPTFSYRIDIKESKNRQPQKSLEKLIKNDVGKSQPKSLDVTFKRTCPKCKFLLKSTGSLDDEDEKIKGKFHVRRTRPTVDGIAEDPSYRPPIKEEKVIKMEQQQKRKEEKVEKVEKSSSVISVIKSSESKLSATLNTEPSPPTPPTTSTPPSTPVSLSKVKSPMLPSKTATVPVSLATQQPGKQQIAAAPSKYGKIVPKQRQEEEETYIDIDIEIYL